MDKKKLIEETNFTHSRRIKAPMWYYNFAEKHYTSAKILEDSGAPYIREVTRLLWGLSIELMLNTTVKRNSTLQIFIKIFLQPLN